MQSLSLCLGLPETPYDAVDHVVGTSRVTKHTVPVAPELYSDDGPPFKVKVFARSENCSVLCNLEDQELCSSCSSVLQCGKKSAVETTAMKSAEEATALKDKAPLASCSKERLIATIKKQRVKCKDLESQIENMRNDISSNSTEIDKALEDDILAILGKNDMKSSPHINLFWQQQKKAPCISYIWSKISPSTNPILPFLAF